MDGEPGYHRICQKNAVKNHHGWPMIQGCTLPEGPFMHVSIHTHTIHTHINYIYHYTIYINICSMRLCVYIYIYLSLTLYIYICRSIYACANANANVKKSAYCWVISTSTCSHSMFNRWSRWPLARGIEVVSTHHLGMAMSCMHMSYQSINIYIYVSHKYLTYMYL